MASGRGAGSGPGPSPPANPPCALGLGTWRRLARCCFQPAHLVPLERSSEPARPQAEGEGRAWKGVHRLRSKGNKFRSRSRAHWLGVGSCGDGGNGGNGGNAEPRIWKLRFEPPRLGRGREVGRGDRSGSGAVAGPRPRFWRVR